MDPQTQSEIVKALQADANDGISRLLAALDQQPTPHEDFEIEHMLRALCDDDSIEEGTRKQLHSDLLVFALNTASPRGQTEWGTYFGPWMSGTEGDDEKPFTVPPVSAITPEVVDRWRKRRQAVRHAFLRARYADAAWDLDRQAGSQHPQSRVPRAG